MTDLMCSILQLLLGNMKFLLDIMEFSLQVFLFEFIVVELLLEISQLETCLLNLFFSCLQLVPGSLQLTIGIVCPQFVLFQLGIQIIQLTGMMLVLSLQLLL